MISSFEVGALFRIQNEASAELIRLAEQVERLDQLVNRTRANMAEMAEIRYGGLTRSLGSVERNMGLVAGASDRMALSVTTGLDSMAVGVGRVTAEMALLRAEMAGIAAAGRAVGVGGAAAGAGASAARGGGGGHGRGGFYTRVHEGPIGAHASVGIGEAAGLMAGFGMLRGLQQAGQEDLAIRAALMSTSTDPNSERGRGLYGRLRQTVAETSYGTIFSHPEIAKMLPSIMGPADMPVEQTLPLLKPAIYFGEYEKQIGAAQHQTWAPEESALALIRLSHSMGITDPSKMSHMADLLAPASSTGDVSPSRLMNVLQYMTSPARGLGMSEQETIGLGAVGSLLFPGTRAGTNIGMMLQKIEQVQAGPLPGASKAQRAHLAMLTRAMSPATRDNPMGMGLIDPRTHQLFRDSSGSLVTPLLEHLQAFEYTHPGKAAGIFQQAFETRGGRAAFELGQGNVPTLYQNQQARTNEFLGLGGIAGAQNIGMEAMNNQARRVWSQLNNVMTDLATGAVPMLTGALRRLGNALEIADKFLISHPGVAAGAGDAAGIAGAYVGARMLGRILGFGGGGGGRGGGGGGIGGRARGGARLGALGAAARGVGPFALLAGGAMLIEHMNTLGNQVDDDGPLTSKRQGAGARAFGREISGIEDGIRGGLRSAFGHSRFWPDNRELRTGIFANAGVGGGVGAGAAGAASMDASLPALSQRMKAGLGLTVNAPITVTTIPLAELAKLIIPAVLSAVQSGLTKALLHNSGAAGGTNESPYTSGAGAYGGPP